MGASWEQSSPSLNDCSIEKCQKRIFRCICVKNRKEGARTEEKKKRFSVLATDASLRCSCNRWLGHHPLLLYNCSLFFTTLQMCRITGFCHTYNSDDCIHFISTNILYVHINMDSEKNGPLAGSCRPIQREKKWAWLTGPDLTSWPASSLHYSHKYVEWIDRSMTFEFTCLPQRKVLKIPIVFRFPTNSAVFGFSRLSWWNRRDFLAGERIFWM